MHRGCVIWFTGLSGAGKSTVSRLVAERLRAHGAKVELLDGDEVRKHLSKGLGFSKEDRDENIRRIGFVCELLARNGVIAIAAAISPYRAVRDELRARIPDFVDLPRGAVVERFYPNAFAPIHFDRSRQGRMNAPDGGYGVLYAAADLRGAFAETFLRTPGRTLLPLDLVRRKSRVRIRLMRALRFVRFAGAGLAKLGATAEVTHGGLPYDAPQSWSQAIHALASAPDGVAYRARHDDDAFCYAIFDRAAPHRQEESREVDIDKDWLWSLAESYGIGLAPPGP